MYTRTAPVINASPKKKGCHRLKPEAAHSPSESLDAYHSLRTPVRNSHLDIWESHWTTQKYLPIC